MHKPNKMKAIVAIAVTMAFIMPVPVLANSEKSANNSDDLCPLLCYDAKGTDIMLDTSNLGALGDRFYAYNAIDPSGVLLEGPVYFDSESPGSITLLKETVISNFIAGGTWAVDTWYGCQQNNGALWTINEVNGTMTLIGGGGAALNGLAYDPTTCNMYGAGSYDLYTVDMNNGNQMLVGPFNTGGLIIGIAFDGEGTLYGEDLIDNLYSINTSTGAAKLIGPLGIDINYAQDMAYDITWNVLYLAAYTGGGQLYTCNVTNGHCTLVGDFQGGAEITGFAIPYVITQPPETPDCPEGPTEGVVGVEYTFSTRTTDPEGEQVFYLWEWGDGTSSEWLGPFDSGDTVEASHAWMETKMYEIKVKAKDVYNRESEWSDPKMIHIIGAPILEIGNITGSLFKVSTVIKNTGGVDADGVDWVVTLDGRIILLGKETSGRIAGIRAGEETTISSSLIFGFGKTVITATAECAEGSSDTNTRDVFVLLFFIL